MDDTVAGHNVSSNNIDNVISDARTPVSKPPDRSIRAFFKEPGPPETGSWEFEGSRTCSVFTKIDKNSQKAPENRVNCEVKRKKIM